jgi:hypothetical protein
MMNDLPQSALKVVEGSSFVEVLARRAALVSLRILICLVTATSPTVAQNVIGHVLDLKGDWYLYAQGAESDQAQRLAKWQDVPAGGVIRITSPTADDSISIADTHLNILVERKCAGPNACYEPIFLPRSLKETNFSQSLDSLLPKVWALLWGEPYETSLHRTRGGSLFDEAIAPLMDGQVNLEESMQHLPNGRYSVAAYNSKSTGPRTPISFMWEPSNQAAVLPLAPGLYEISLSPAGDGDQPILNLSVCVLVVQSDMYPAARAEFQRIRASTERWATVTSAETVHDFLRAYLSELFSTSGMNKP